MNIITLTIFNMFFIEYHFLLLITFFIRGRKIKKLNQSSLFLHLKIFLFFNEVSLVELNYI
jgi:hypothetical protein